MNLNQKIIKPKIGLRLFRTFCGVAMNENMGYSDMGKYIILNK
jgi:hypothetical protein